MRNKAAELSRFAHWFIKVILSITDPTFLSFQIPFLRSTHWWLGYHKQHTPIALHKLLSKTPSTQNVEQADDLTLHSSSTRILPPSASVPSPLLTTLQRTHSAYTSDITLSTSPAGSTLGDNAISHQYIHIYHVISYHMERMSACADH